MSIYRIISKKYINLIKKFAGNILRKRIGWRKKLTKSLKFFYLLIMLPIEIIGDILFFWKRFQRPEIKGPKKILITKIDQFGDVLFSTFLLPPIKKKWPDAQIDYLINPKTEFVIKNNPFISNIHYWDDPFLYFLLGREKNKEAGIFSILGKNWKILSKLKKVRYDVVINTRAYSPSSNIFWKFIKPKNLIAFNLSEQSFLADFWAFYDLYDEEWKNYLNLLKPLGVDIGTAEFSPQFNNFDDEGLKNKMPDLKEKAKLVVISPISFDGERCWLEKYWKAVINYLLNNNYQVVLTGMENQEVFLQNLVLDNKNNNLKIATNLSISELGSLFKKANFFIGIDSFPAHLALAINKPIVCLLNEKAYYLKGFSGRKFAIDTRSMIPLINKVKIFLLENKSDEIISFINNEFDI